ncbi:MAG: hypothetical protein DME25_10570 [Verrucomicrobia bacterium]|nr:MAG: hypothetical protein DME25_10570 [Verrucomicrobiota bacterium]
MSRAKTRGGNRKQIMARKLSSEEAKIFERALQMEQEPLRKTGGDAFLQRLNHQRDASLALSPEWNQWFGEAIGLPRRYGAHEVRRPA